MPRLAPVASLQWFDGAEIRLSYTVTIRATPDIIFGVLADHERWPDWFPTVKSVANIDPERGPGARRSVKVPPLSVDELFFVWDPPRRYSFTITSINLPIVTQMAEDWQIDAADHGATVTNTVAANLPRALRPLRGPVRAAMRRSTAPGPVHLKRHIESGL